MIYPALGIRTDFSLGESIIAIKDLPQIAENCDTKLLGLCETMSVSSLIEASKTMTKDGLDLIAGVRIRVVMAASKEDEACFIKLYPLDEIGMQSIYRLLSRGFEEDRFYYFARVTWDDIENIVAHDHVAITTGDTQSVAQREDMLEALATLAARVSFAASFYELVPSDTPYYSRQNHLAIEWGEANGFSPLVVQPSFWMGADMHTYSINAGIADRRPYEDYLRPVPQYRPLTTVELVAKAMEATAAIQTRYGAVANTQFKEGIRNTEVLANLCTWRWAKQAPSLPVIAADANAALKDLCRTGLKERFTTRVFAHKPTPAEISADYVPRLKFELDTLERLGFADYFLLVADLVRWAKSQGIYVGPGRGSVGGSLVAYLIGITDVDPIRFKLLFERFINPDRLDLPDADLDFMSTRREEVITYLEQRWGIEKVAGIVNYNTMGARGSVRDVGRIHGLTGDQLGATKFIGDTHGVSMSLDEAYELQDEIKDFAAHQPAVWNHARKLEGKMRAFGTHAAGVVVSGCVLTERAVVERRGGARVINWDKRVSEEQGLIKLDVLGLSTLDVFDYAIKLIFRRHSIKLDINALDLTDEKTLAIFTTAHTAGVFQFEGGSVRRLLKEMAADAPLIFDDLVALNALNRPGPLDAGLTQSYIKRRAGKEAVIYPHALAEPYLKDTYGVIVFQEQVMQVARAVAGFTPGEADGLRRIMGKKLPAEMAKLREKFVEGTVATAGMTDVEGGALFDMIEGFAGYGFNKSHSCAYSLISFQAAYLKAHYTVEFYTASMSVADDAKLPSIVKQAKEDGMRVIPPDVNVSSAVFEPLNDVVIAAPLSAVRNVSHKGAHAIVEARRKPEATIVETTTGRGAKKVTTTQTFGPGRFVSMEDFVARVPARAVNSRSIEHLDRVGAFSRIVPGQASSLSLTRQRDQIELMPALSDQGVAAERRIKVDELAHDALLQNHFECEKLLGKAAVPIEVGKQAKFMVILDAPFNDYQGIPQQYSYREFVMPALHAAGMTADDAVWTYVMRRPKNKGERDLPAEELKSGAIFLNREIEITKPPIIVTLGAYSTKHFFPELKGLADHVGQKHYSAAMDATVIIGFNPTQIYHDADKVEQLTAIFADVKSLVEDSA